MDGGNTTPVSREGDRVRRTAGPWTPTVHRLLAHLRAGGYTYAPEPISYDATHELVSYLAGEVPHDPMPDWAWSEDVLTAAAANLRAMHDATAGFDTEGAVWRLEAHEPEEVVCHNDFAPYNLVFNQDHELTGVIDWDTASPGPRAWDLAYLAYRLVPLAAPDNPDARPLPVAERRHRLAKLCTAYGGITPAEVVRAAVPRLAELADFTRARGPDFAPHVRLYEAAADWIGEHGGLMAP